MSITPTLRTTALETIVLSRGAAAAAIAPERGGIVTQWQVGPDALLYLDEATLLDPGKNVRGGNPVLFPSPGRLENDRYRRGELEGAMGQHGFARNRAWNVIAQTDDSATLRLSSSPETRAVFACDFEATYRYELAERSLRIEQRFETSGPGPMPFGAGFHPYFAVPSARKARARIRTPATRAWDNAAKKSIDLQGPIDLTAPEVDLHLSDHGSSEAALELGDGRTLAIRCSSEFCRWVVWTLAGRDFVCLEPWTAPANALNTGKDLLVATASAPVTLFVELTLE